MVMEEEFHPSAMEILAAQALLALKNDPSLLRSFSSSSTSSSNKDNTVVDDGIIGMDERGVLLERIMFNKIPKKRRGSHRPVISDDIKCSSSTNNNNNNNVVEKDSRLGTTDITGTIRKPIIIRIKFGACKNQNTNGVSASCNPSSESESPKEKKTVLVKSVTSSEQLAVDADHVTTAVKEETQKRKRRPHHEKMGEDDEDQLAAATHHVSKKMKRPPSTAASPAVIPPIPQALENMIRSELGGDDVRFVIQKRLFATDLNDNNGRLSMPLRQIKDLGFLTPYETDNLNILDKNNPLAAMNNLLFIDPKLQKKTVTLKRWDMNGSSSSYVFMTTWKDIAKDNKLQKGNLVQVWSFRVAMKLCFALVVLH